MELEVVMDLDLLSQTIIFGSILTTFELSHFLETLASASNQTTIRKFS